MSGEVNKAVAGAMAGVFFADRGDFISLVVLVLGVLMSVYHPENTRIADMLVGGGLMGLRLKAISS